MEVIDPARMLVRNVHGTSTASASSTAAEAIAVRFISTSDRRRNSVGDAAVRAAAAIGSTLEDIIDHDRLDAVSVRCFDLLSDPGTSGCLALATLNDDGIVAGCEGDVPSTLAMMWIRYLLDQPSWMANPARVDVEHNRIVLAHCTVAPSMVGSIALSTHFESGKGVGISGRFDEQPVTLVRIGGVDLDERWIAEGRIVGTGDDPDLCRTQVTVELDGRSVEELLDAPLGNHITLATGHHRSRLERWWRLAIVS
jgi:L-fucose isomerase-like protein